MADPQRLLDDPALSPLARAVLRAAADDTPPADRQRIAAGRLAIALGVPAIAGEASAVATVGAFWWKLIVIAIAFGAAATHDVPDATPPAAAVIEPRREPPAAVVEPRHEPPAAPVVATPATPPPTAPVREPAPRVKAPASRPPVEVAHEEVTEVVEEPRPEPVVAKQEPPPEPAAPVSVDARRLAAEVALLDRARGALRAADPNAALRALDDHRREFPDGALRAEADVVRIEALLRLNRKAEAVELGNAMLARSPRSPLAKRVQSLIAK